ncbi:hypothetical protein A2U01_0112790, partial [Trifolium medium]|nr:hypothetical protein [Trifolium medium]
SFGLVLFQPSPPP